MFCKNCGNKLTEGQAFCTNCGAKQEPLENNAAPTTPVENPANGDNFQNNGNINNNQSQMGNIPSPSVNNNAVENSNGDPKKNNSIKFIAIVVGIFLAVIVIPAAISVVQDLKKTSDMDNANKQVYKGYNFYIPKEYTVSVSDTEGLVLTKSDITYSIEVDNSTYEENYQTVVTAKPQLKDGLEFEINNREVSAAYTIDYNIILFTKASNTQTFFVTITRKSGKVSRSQIKEVVDILDTTQKDASTFAGGTDSDDTASEKVEENKNNMENNIEVK